VRLPVVSERSEVVADHSVVTDRGVVTDHGVQVALDAPSYLDFLEREYLATYVGRGGAAVKLLVVDDESSAEELVDGLDAVGDGFQHVAVDAVTTRVHMIDQVFAAVARQLDWIALAEAVVYRAFDVAGFPPPNRFDLSVSTVAAHHEVDSAELYRSVRRTIEQIVLKNCDLSHEFRMAMLRLCQSRLGRGDRLAAGRAGTCR
jgi:hypothetical protein